MTSLEKIEDELPQLIKRFGNAEAAILLHSGYSIFQVPEIEGAIGYHKIDHSALVIGGPICLPESIEALTTAFHRFCEEQQLKIVYFLVQKNFADWGISKGYKTLIQIGEEMSINPMTFQFKHKLRWSIKHAIKEGVVVKEYQSPDAALEKEIKRTILTWQTNRHGPQMYMGTVDFSEVAENRIFYAEFQDKIVGVLLLSPLDSIPGWTVNSYFALADAPVGVTEFLMATTVDTLSHENCPFLCVGIISDPQFGETIGLHPVAKFLAHLILKMVRRVFKLEARANYFKKYHPEAKPVYLLSPNHLSLMDLFSLKNLLHVKL